MNKVTGNRKSSDSGDDNVDLRTMDSDNEELKSPATPSIGTQIDSLYKVSIGDEMRKKKAVDDIISGDNGSPNALPEEDGEDFVGLVDNDVLDEDRSAKTSLGKFGRVSSFLVKLKNKAKSKSDKAKNEIREIEQTPAREFGDRSTPERIRRLLKESHLGIKESQFTLAYCYDVGTGGVEADTEEAIQWYSAAAIQGHAIAQNNLGVLYTSGHKGRVPRQAAEALYWFKQGADNGNRSAAFHAGLAFLNGDGMESKDDNQAFKYFKIAAKLGHMLAQTNVGAMYLCGRGTDKNHKKAVKWLKKAAKNGKGDPVAMHNLGVCYEKGFGIAKDSVKAEENFQAAQLSGSINEELALRSREKGLTLFNS
jgi:TPR repeat protein